MGTDSGGKLCHMQGKAGLREEVRMATGQVHNRANWPGPGKLSGTKYKGPEYLWILSFTCFIKKTFQAQAVIAN